MYNQLVLRSVCVMCAGKNHVALFPAMVLAAVLTLAVPLTAGADPGLPDVPPKPVRYEHGVLFNVTRFSVADIAGELEKIAADGFNQVELSSWAWTDIEPGSSERAKYERALRWCDEHDMIVWLLHNVQFGNHPKLDRAYLDTESVKDRMQNWARLLKGHSSVRGILLGNETSPLAAIKQADTWEQKHPRFMAGFRHYLLQQHGTLTNLNRHWGTAFNDLGEITFPAGENAAAWRPKGFDNPLGLVYAMKRFRDPVFVDMARYARLQFARYHETIIADYLKPILGDTLDYASKINNGNPYTNRAVDSYTVASWDEVMTKTPPHLVQMLVDTLWIPTGKPVYDSEIHLYHDKHDYKPTPSSIRYTVFRHHVQGQFMASSYNWHGWTEPEIRKLHQGALPVFRDVRQQLGVLGYFRESRRSAPIKVLVTEFNRTTARWPTDRADRFGHGGVVHAYANIAALGRQWQYILDWDLHRVQAGDTVVVASHALTRAALHDLVALPEACTIVLIGKTPPSNDWGRPHPASDMQALLRRSEVISGWSELDRVVEPLLALPEPMRQVDVIDCWAYNRKLQQYRYAVPAPRLELRWADAGDDHRLLAVLNHSAGRTVESTLPWSEGVRVLWSRGVTRLENRRFRFEPETVGLFLVREPGS